MRFVSPCPLTGCWWWTGRGDRKGYGKVNIFGSTERPHRISFRLFRGPLPDGLFVCHRCDNPACVNPEHLFLGTNSDNMRDRRDKGRDPAHLKPKTHCKRGHKFGAVNRRGHHRCNIWRRLAERRLLLEVRQ